MEAMLKHKDVPIGDAVVRIRELSALQYLDQQDYMGSMVAPPEVTGDESQQELDSISRSWNRLTLDGRSRLIAYSLADPDADIDDFQLTVQQSYSFDVIKLLHDEIAVLSGFKLVGQEVADSEQEDADENAESSPK